VRDHGPGVAARHLGRIFEPFHRGQDELTRTAPGTGLGLALVKSLVERMGGAVSGRNAPDGGFEVRVSLS
jgi:signal transduction histidine kinase